MSSHRRLFAFGAVMIVAAGCDNTVVSGGDDLLVAPCVTGACADQAVLSDLSVTPGGDLTPGPGADLLAAPARDLLPTDGSDLLAAPDATCPLCVDLGRDDACAGGACSDGAAPRDAAVGDLARMACGVDGGAAACAPGMSCCSALCSDLQGDIANCGACGAACSLQNIVPACVVGGCESGVCTVDHDDCNHDKRRDGCEVDLVTNVDNCDGCGVACSANHITRSCVQRSCEMGVCEAGWLDCNANKRGDGCEAQVAVDVDHCGSCGAPCSANHVVARACAGGACVSPCSAGFADCNHDLRADGCESDPQRDAANCGGCGRVCSAANLTPTCSGGSCEGASCFAGAADCNMNKQADGCEINTLTDAANCGVGGPGAAGPNPMTGCGQACSTSHVTRACANGSCASGICDAGWADCNLDKRGDGCEVNVAQDTRNCGGCGVVCSANHVTPSCIGGSCEMGACAAGFLDCNRSKQKDGCEVDSRTDAMNCGVCGKICAAGMTCVAGNCLTPCNVKVNEVVVASARSAADEWVELVNPCAAAVDLTAYSLLYRAPAAAVDTTLVFSIGSKLARPSLAAGGHVVLASLFADASIPSAASWSTGGNAGTLEPAGGGVALRDPNFVIVDSVAWGVGPPAFVETVAAVAPVATGALPGASIGRKPDGRDTNDNSRDFASYATGTPGATNP